MLTFSLGPAWLLLQARFMRSMEGALSCKERYTKKSQSETSELPSVASRNPGLHSAGSRSADPGTKVWRVIC